MCVKTNMLKNDFVIIAKYIFDQAKIKESMNIHDG